MATSSPPPDALLLLTSVCPHCPSVLESLIALLKEGVIGRLELVNIAAHPEVAQAVGARTVPWMRVGQFELEGVLTSGELRHWAEICNTAEGIAEYFYHMLKHGRRDKVERLIRAKPQHAAVLAELMANPAASMAVRLGIGAVLEEFHGTSLASPMIPTLAELTQSGDALTRADACHFLTLIGGEAVVPHLRNCLNDEAAEVREIAQEALDIMGSK